MNPSIPSEKRSLPLAPKATWPRYQVNGQLDLARLRAEAHALAEEIRPRLEPPRRGRAHLLHRLASYRTAAQNYLENRRRAAVGREDLLPLLFIWTTHRPCNFRCSYCDDHRGAKYPELDGHGKLDTARGARLLEVMRTRTPSVYFAGGEPTLRKDLPSLVRRARDLDYFPIVLNTNGSRFHDLLRRPEWSTFLADVDVLVVSLDALDLELLAKMWVTGSPEDVLRNLFVLRELAAEQRVKLMVNTVIQPGLVAEARRVLDLATELGIWFCPVPRNVGAGIDPALLADPEYHAFVAELLRRKRAGARISGSLRMNQRLLSADRLECRNALKPHLDHDGRLPWPCKSSVNVAPEWIDVLAYDHVDQVWAEATRRRDPRGFHGPGADQCGGDCCWAQNYVTDEYAHGLVEPLGLMRAVVEFLRA